MLKLSLYTLLFFLSVSTAHAQMAQLRMKISKNYINLPVSHKQDRQRMQISVQNKPELNFLIRLAESEPDYWVFRDVSAYKGKTLDITYGGSAEALKKIYQDDRIAGQDSLYHESNRPRYHFTTRRGWINDPNGLIFYAGEYHLFYQHNPYERDWENMSWGHAVSSDLVHWKEIGEALNPDAMGTMFSGSAVIDYANTSGFGRRDNPAMVAFFTVDNPKKQVQCMAYSLDRGRTWTKYAGNPLIDSKAKWNSKDTRDPKVFWYAPGKHWVMVLNERDGHSIYTSADLKAWTYQSHTTGFWECPELFELPVNGDANMKKWVMYGASGTYMLGSFDGKTFHPEAGKYAYTAGSVYAAQTYTNIPAEDGRRIQLGWGRISHPGMPFNGMMLLPTQLTLRRTKEGIRLFSEPVRETAQLFTPEGRFTNLKAKEANEKLAGWSGKDALRIKTKIKLSHATSAGLSLSGQAIIDYDMNANLINGRFYSPEDRTGMTLSADIYIDKTSVEVFIDGGAWSYSFERKPDPKNSEGFQFRGTDITVENLEIFGAKPAWP